MKTPQVWAHKQEAASSGIGSTCKLWSGCQNQTPTVRINIPKNFRVCCSWQQSPTQQFPDTLSSPLSKAAAAQSTHTHNVYQVLLPRFFFSEALINTTFMFSSSPFSTSMRPGCVWISQIINSSYLPAARTAHTTRGVFVNTRKR